MLRDASNHILNSVRHSIELTFRLGNILINIEFERIKLELIKSLLSNNVCMRRTVHIIENTAIFLNNLEETHRILFI